MRITIQWLASSLAHMALEKVPRNGIYGPLDPSKHEIRIAEVQEVSFPGKLNCRLETISLLSDSPPEYEAVSWYWGDPTPNDTIEVNGETLRISQNAVEVLRGICLGRQRVWLDAICINQDDLNERSQQVAIMPEVYSKALKTLVWLGESDDSTPAAVEGICKIFDQCKAETNDFADLQSQVYSMIQDGYPSALPVLRFSELPLPSCDWQAIASYFSFNLPFETILCALLWMQHRRYNRTMFWDGFRPEIDDAYFIFLLGQSRSKQHRFIGSQVLQMSLTSLLATEPHDKVYGLLGLLEDPNNTKRIVPHYEEPLHRVFTAAVKLCIVRASGADQLVLLQFIGRVKPALRVEEECDQLPSWVPPLDCKVAPNGVKLFSAPTPNYYPGAAYGLVSTIAEQDDLTSPILGIQGLEVNQLSTELLNTSIEMPFSVSNFAGSFAVFHKIVFQVWPFLQERFEDENSFETMFAFTLLRRTRLAVQFEAQDPVEFMEHFRTMMSGIRHLMEEYGLGASAESMHLPERQADQLFDSIADLPCFGTLCRTMFFNKLFLTNDGHLIMAPPSSKTGDSLCILFGGTTPFILRQEGDHWNLIGNAYVHSMMEASPPKPLTLTHTIHD